MYEATSPDTFAGSPRSMTPQEAARYAWQREKWGDHADFLADLEADMRRQLSRPAPPPCPDWCTETNHDGYEDLTDDPNGRQMRSHMLDVSPSVTIVVEEYREANDAITRGKPSVLVETPNKGELSSEQAQELGEALLRAVAKFDEIGAAA